MGNTHALPGAAFPVWRMPVTPQGYDRSPLSDDERDALATLGPATGAQHATLQARHARQVLARFARPLSDVASLHSQNPVQARRWILPMMYREMHRVQMSFWDWPATVWCALIGTDLERFAATQGGTKTTESRAAIRTAAYLFGEVTDLRSVGMGGDATPMARALFGATLIDSQVQRVRDILSQDGDSAGRAASDKLRGTLCLLFLLNRSPYLECMTVDTLDALLAYPTQNPAQDRSQAHKVGRALWMLGIITADEHTRVARGAVVAEHRTTADVPPLWLAWCRAWNAQAKGLTPTTHASHYRLLLAVGRWLAQTHPAIVSPEQWDEALADEYVTAVCASRTGDGASARTSAWLKKRGVFGQPVRPTTIDNKLQAMRRVFTDWQDIPHRVGDQAPARLPVRFKPDHAFRTPQHIRRLIQPDPRDIDAALWWKLVSAAATLTAADLHPHRAYPLAFVHAVALLWVTAARRPNEIGRLRVGCVRRDWEPAMRDADGLPLAPESQFTYLHVPSSKTRGPFWVPIPAYTADAVAAWERERPAGQAPLLDRKDRALVDFLFSYRGLHLGTSWINVVLIPILCRRANVPEADARGAITAHRGRSTIATLLRRAGVPLDDISTFLGHTSPEMVKHDARTDPFQHARTMRKADDLLRIVEGLLDPQAAAQGQPSVFFYLGYGPDKRPRFCGNPAWHACAHRLACQQCQMYIDADQAEELEQREGVIRFEAKIPMLPEEKALAEGDTARMQLLVESKQQVPVPEPPSPAFIFHQTVPAIPASDLHQAHGVEWRQQVEERLADLQGQLAVARTHTDGRNVVLRSLEQQISTLTAILAANTCGAEGTSTEPRSPSTNHHPTRP